MQKLRKYRAYVETFKGAVDDSAAEQHGRLGEVEALAKAAADGLAERLGKLEAAVEPQMSEARRIMNDVHQTQKEQQEFLLKFSERGSVETVVEEVS